MTASPLTLQVELDFTELGSFAQDSPDVVKSGAVRGFSGRIRVVRRLSRCFGAPGGTRTPNRFLRTELLFH